MRLLLRLAPAVGATLVLTATAVQAREAPERELQMLGRCALASSVYKSLLPPSTAPVTVTEADKELYARLKTAEPLLQLRADALAGAVEPAARDTIAKELREQFQAQMAPKDGPRKSPRDALDLYAPILEACIVRATLLPKE